MWEIRESPFKTVRRILPRPFLTSHFPLLTSHCPQHFLYFFPLPQGHGSLRPTFSTVTGRGGLEAG
jgi:hypothetical protein